MPLLINLTNILSFYFACNHGLVYPPDFGRTYLCEDLNRFNELCVLKEFAPQVQGTALITKAQELFEREAGVLYRLQHHQIPRFREMFRVSGTGKGQLFLVQDYVAGETYQIYWESDKDRDKPLAKQKLSIYSSKFYPYLSISIPSVSFIAIFLPITWLRVKTMGNRC